MCVCAERKRERVCVCVCVRVRASECVCGVLVCVSHVKCWGGWINVSLF